MLATRTVLARPHKRNSNQLSQDRNCPHGIAGALIVQRFCVGASILALSALLIGCSSTTPAPAPTAATVATVPAAPATSAAATNANTPGAFSKTDPQLAPPGIKGDAANGAKLFTAKRIECDGCHDVTKNFPGGDFAPNQANVSVVAQSILKSQDYKGKAKTVEEYIRESILAPNVYIVPGDDYREKDGTSAMKQDFAQTLTPQQVEDLVAYLLSLKPQ